VPPAIAVATVVVAADRCRCVGFVVVVIAVVVFVVVFVVANKLLSTPPPCLRWTNELEKSTDVTREWQKCPSDIYECHFFSGEFREVNDTRASQTNGDKRTGKKHRCDKGMAKMPKVIYI
jgi:hypothetical protein